MFFLSKNRNRCVIQEQLLQFWRSPVAPAHLARLGDLQETLREPTQNGWFDEKSFFYTCTTVLYWKNKYSKVLNGDDHGTSTGTSYRISRGPNDRTFRERPWNVCHRCFFLIQLRNMLNLLLQITQDFIVNCSSEKFSEKYSA